MVNCDYLYDKEYFQEQFEKQYFADKELSYECYENAYIVPNKGYCSGVYTEQRQYIACSALCNPAGALSEKDEVFDKAEYWSETVIYLSLLSDVWGHALTDVIRRFWFIKASAFREKFGDCRLVLCGVGWGNISDNEKKLFQILGGGGRNLPT